MSATVLPDVTRALLLARAERLATRLRGLADVLPADIAAESLASAHGLLGRLDAQIDTVILAARRRGE